ncbi:Nephrin-like 9 [Homarus americanus]|uniref:Nephrin-like 9 n=1 Tax=Homarus americanus TaxID=6706 RepID=A0A8J5JPF8_HOMAM|nr:Nephrin-like 9 [Homarus americanus]
MYDAPRLVAITGPSQVEEGKTLDLTCTTSVSNPPASLTWSVAGEIVEETKSVVGRHEDGGWVTSSDLIRYPMGRANVSEVMVECHALNPAVNHIVKQFKSITVTKPPGVPVFEGNLRREVVAGTTLDVTCTTVGGHPPPTMRIYKEAEATLTDLRREGNLTRARAEVRVAPEDNGAKLTCEASSSPQTTPVSTSSTLTVLCKTLAVNNTSSSPPYTHTHTHTRTLKVSHDVGLVSSGSAWSHVMH